MLPTQAATPAVVLDHRLMSSVVANGPGIAPPPVHALSDPVPAWPGVVAVAAAPPPPALRDRWPATGTRDNFTPGFGSGFCDRALRIGPYPPLSSAVVIGPGFSLISYKLLASITSGAFIDLATLLRAPSDEPTMPTISNNGHLVLPPSSGRNRQNLDKIQWVQAFGLYPVVMVSYFRHRARDLVLYQATGPPHVLSLWWFRVALVR